MTFTSKTPAIVEVPGGRHLCVLAGELEVTFGGSLLGEGREDGSSTQWDAVWWEYDHQDAPGGVWMIWKNSGDKVDSWDFQPINGTKLIKDFVFEVSSEESQ